jgi:hypothetical protein
MLLKMSGVQHILCDKLFFLRERPFNLKKKIFWFPLLLKKIFW